MYVIRNICIKLRALPLCNDLCIIVERQGMNMDGERIKSRRRELGLSADSLAKALGTTRVTIGRWEKGKHEPDDQTKIALAKILQTSVAFLIGETEDSSPVKEQRQRLTVGINLDDPATLTHVLEQLREKKIKSSGLIDDDPEPTIPDQIELPIIDQEACAGEGFDFCDVESIAQDWLPFPILKMGGPVGPRKPYFVRVEGDSMTGVGIKDGALVLINPNVEVLNGNPAYVCWRGRCSIKGFIQYASGDIELRPANPNYKSIYIAAEDIGSEEFRIMGKVVRWVNEGVPGDVV